MLVREAEGEVGVLKEEGGEGLGGPGGGWAFYQAGVVGGFVVSDCGGRDAGDGVAG